MNRLEVGVGIVITGFGLWNLVMLLLSISGLSGYTSVGITDPPSITPFVSLKSLEEAIVIIWASSSAGVALIVDGLHRRRPTKVHVE